MTESERVNFNAIMLGMYDVYSKQPNDNTTKLYFSILQQYELQQVLSAINACVSSLKFFPKPAEIIEQIGGKQDDIIDFAFEDAKRLAKEIGFYSSVKMKDKISMRVIRDFGGLQIWCESVYQDENKLYFEFKRMYKRYFELMKRGEWEPDIDYLTGYSEDLAHKNACGGTSKLLLWNNKKVAEKLIGSGTKLIEAPKDETNIEVDVMKLLSGVMK